MASRLVRTASGGSFTTDITPADVVDRCDDCRRVFREGDCFCGHLAAQHGCTIARLTPGMPTATSPGRSLGTLAPVFLVPEV